MRRPCGAGETRAQTLHYLKFWLEAEHFRTDAAAGTDERRSQALNIYTLFVARESPHRIRLPDAAVAAVQAGAVCVSCTNKLTAAAVSGDGPVPATCFDAAQQLCRACMDAHLFPPFRDSELYATFLISTLTADTLTLEARPILQRQQLTNRRMSC